MNKQELIKHFEKMEYVSIVQMEKKSFIDMIEQLDEPQKPVVPQFVADWYEEHKDDFDYRVWECIYHDGEGEQTEMSEWICQNENAIITLVNMHQFGYTVEKEKKYTVKLTKTQQYLYCIDNDFTFVTYARPDDNPRLYHTRKELEKAGFGEVFNSPLFEVEEVE